jgi:hypothetical protein
VATPKPVVAEAFPTMYLQLASDTGSPADIEEETIASNALKAAGRSLPEMRCSSAARRATSSVAQSSPAPNDASSNTCCGAYS